MPEAKTPSALIVQRLDSGLWRVKEAEGDKLMDLYYKGAAIVFATSWAKVHSVFEVLVYNEHSQQVEQIIRTLL